MNHAQRLSRTIDGIRSSLWFTPTVAVLLATILLVVLLVADAYVNVDGVLGFGGSPLEAREVASTVAGAMLSFIAVVFSITIVALQLASGQFSPRVLRTFLRDRLTKATLGAFVATFWYSLMLVKFLDASLDEVPDLTLDAMFVLAFTSVAMFIAYIHRVAQSIRVVNILEEVADETRDAIDRLLPEPGSPPVTASAEHHGDAHPVHASGPGVVVSIDHESLVALATRHDCTIELAVAVGDYARTGAVVARAWGDTPPPETAVRDAILLGVERTMQQDVEFGFRQIVDVAERALSPGTNDPTTAVQAIDRLHDLLGRVAARPDPPRWLRDADDAVRVETPIRTWEDYVVLAVDPLRICARQSLQVHQRLRAMVDDLVEATDGARQAILLRCIDDLDATARHAFELGRDERAASTPDDRG